MDFETMVKEAYEEITGLEKEAGLLSNIGSAVKNTGKSIGGIASNIKVKAGAGMDYLKANQQLKKATKATNAFNASPEGVGLKKHMDNALQGYENAKKTPGFLTSTHRGAAIGFAKDKAVQDYEGALLRSGGLSKWQMKDKENSVRKLKDRFNNISVFGKKAAAYYDEAQLIKKAAEADYAEACAYEEAAIQILDEPGYLD